MFGNYCRARRALGQRRERTEHSRHGDMSAAICECRCGLNVGWQSGVAGLCMRTQCHQSRISKAETWRRIFIDLWAVASGHREAGPRWTATTETSEPVPRSSGRVSVVSCLKPQPGWVWGVLRSRRTQIRTLQDREGLEAARRARAGTHRPEAHKGTSLSGLWCAGLASQPCEHGSERAKVGVNASIRGSTHGS